MVWGVNLSYIPKQRKRDLYRDSTYRSVFWGQKKACAYFSWRATIAHVHSVGRISDLTRWHRRTSVNHGAANRQLFSYATNGGNRQVLLVVAWNVHVQSRCWMYGGSAQDMYFAKPSHSCIICIICVSGTVGLSKRQAISVKRVSKVCIPYDL